MGNASYRWAGYGKGIQMSYRVVINFAKKDSKLAHETENLDEAREVHLSIQNQIDDRWLDMNVGIYMQETKTVNGCEKVSWTYVS